MDEDRKIIRESKSIDNIKSQYEIGDIPVPFPYVMFFLCILVDVIDIILTITAFGILPWWIFTMFIFTPILMLYISSRDKKYSIKSIQASIETRSKLSAVRESGRLTREAKALRVAGKTTEALEKAADAAKAIQKLPPWVRSLFVLLENIPFIEFLPMNSILLYMSYIDNKNSISEAKKSMESLANSMEFKIDKSITRLKGSVK